MYVLEKAKEEIADVVQKALPRGAACNVGMLEKPPQKEMGDLAFPCFGLAKELKKAPQKIAEEIAASVKPSGLVAGAEAAGPYVNFRLDRQRISEAVIEEIFAASEKYGSAAGSGEKVMVEYAQPNTHKEIHVGHLRNLCLGLSVVRLLRAAGYEVVPVSYRGDTGAHVAKCLWAYRKYHEGETPPEDKGKYLGAIYSEAAAKTEGDESLKEEVAEVQRKLEAGDPEWIALWKETREWSIGEMAAIFSELGIAFDRSYYESEVEGPGKEMVAEMLKDGIAKESQGAVIVDLEDEGLGAFLLLKSDGSALYSTKELALAKLKFSEFDVSSSIHIVDARQNLYFRQFFSVLKRIGFDKRLVHVPYEFVTLKETAMSSRKGNVVVYGDFRDKITELAVDETKKRHGDWGTEKVHDTAWIIAEGAMKFGMLRQDTDKPIVFDIDEALSFDGFTGPYIQYAHARLCSILAKAGLGAKIEPAGCEGEEEYAALRKAAEFPQTVLEAAGQFRPSILAQYMFELAQVCNDFYRDVPVLNATGGEKARRLAIISALKTVLDNGLYMLGIRAPREM